MIQVHMGGYPHNRVQYLIRSSPNLLQRISATDRRRPAQAGDPGGGDKGGGTGGCRK